MGFERRTRDAGVDLDMALTTPGNFDLVALVDDMAYVAGCIALAEGSAAFQGRLGADIDVETGQKSARGAATTLLAALHQYSGGLDCVRRVVRLTGYVKSAPGFSAQPKVMDGASDLMVEVFDDAGRHARSAIGVAELPFGASVEVEAIFQINQ